MDCQNVFDSWGCMLTQNTMLTSSPAGAAQAVPHARIRHRTIDKTLFTLMLPLH
jgi:hypothetical protein